MWKWDQSEGELSHNGVFVTKGYSGNGRGVNNPALQGERAVGPVPDGNWKIVEMYNSKRVGPYALVLHAVDPTPDDDRHDRTNRSAFRIHGDNSKGNRSASHGCIILPRIYRERIWRSGDRDLLVVT